MPTIIAVNILKYIVLYNLLYNIFICILCVFLVEYHSERKIIKENYNIFTI